MYPIPSPNIQNILRNTKRTRNTHQNEETEPNIKNKNKSDSFYLQCEHEHTFFNPMQARPFFGATLNWGGVRGGGGGRAWRIPPHRIFLIIRCMRLNLGRNTNWAKIFITEH